VSSLAPLWKLGEVNPATPEFQALDEGDKIAFMPLEAVWPGDRADYSRTISWSKKLSYTQFRRGDVLIPKITPTFEAGRSIVADIPTAIGLATTEVHVVRPHPGGDPRYLCYVAQSLPFLGEGAHSLQGVGNLRRITPRFVQQQLLLDAKPDKQNAISDYLDHEIGEIDGMLAKMDEMAATLMTRREVMIDSETRVGKPTQLQYLIKEGAPLTYGIVQAGEPVNDGVPYIGPSDIVKHQVVAVDQLRKTTFKIAANYERSVVANGDLVVSIGPAYGKTTAIRASHAGANLTQDTARVRCDESKCDPRYVQWALRSRSANVFWDSRIMGATFRRLNLNLLALTPIPLPSPAEQVRIADHLDEVTGKIDAMLAKVAELKSLLIERRAALITDVVTGKKEIA
jgi:type I restriction enzyme S subunit